MTLRTADRRGVGGAWSAGEGTVTGPLASDGIKGGRGIARESFGSPGIAYLPASIGPIGREPIVSNSAETSSVEPKSLHAVGDTAITKQTKPIEREARASAVADEPLATFVIAGFDAHCRRHIEAIKRCRERRATLGLEAPLSVVVRSGCVVVERREGAALQGNVGTGVDGAALCRLVGAVFRRLFVQKSLAVKPAQRAIANAPDDAFKHVARGGLKRTEADPTPIAGCEHTVGHNGVEVKVEVQASAESLDVVDRRGLAFGDPCRALVLERDGLNENPLERSRDAGAIVAALRDIAETDGVHDEENALIDSFVEALDVDLGATERVIGDWVRSGDMASIL